MSKAKPEGEIVTFATDIHLDLTSALTKRMLKEFVEGTITQTLEENPDAELSMLVGIVMQKTAGKADPADVQKQLLERLEDGKT